ncbi:MAG TPA: hypothetical protein DIS76_02090 [Rhodospirillaceae bacterium]|nr:hypothetical protein [Rhodospirillaceae bacterium]
MPTTSREGTIELTLRIYNNRFMTRHKSFINLLILMVFIGIGLFSPLAVAKTQIQQLRLSLNGDMTRVVIDLSAPARLSAQLYENPDRVEIHVPGAAWAAPGFTPGDASVVREFEANGENITLLLRRQATIANVFSLAPDGPRPDRLVIDLKPSTPAEYATKLGEATPLNPAVRKAGSIEKVIGTLQDKSEQKKNVLREKTKTVEKTPEIEKTAAVEKSEPALKAPPAKKPLVVIDAGHGGQDPGAIGRNGAREKDITLSVARRLRDALLESKKYRVVMVRDKDVYLKLAERVAVAQRNKADLFISLHADTVGQDSDPDLTHGASIYTISDQASDEVSARLAARENKADLIGGKPDLASGAVGTILLDLLNQETMMRSKDFAAAIANGFTGHKIVMLRRPLRSAGFAVLKGADFPSVLIEMGFLSSNKDGNLLQQKDYQQRLAVAIVAGVDDFFASDKLASLSE